MIRRYRSKMATEVLYTIEAQEVPFDDEAS